MPFDRPLVHFTPPAHWLNDPNGLVFLDEEWHLFYQYQPADSGQKHWSHAVSRGLAHWKHLSVALYPDERGAIWSGSCVVDRHDTSGFFDGGSGLVAIFPYHKDTPSRQSQSQSLAYPRDKGRTWTKYENNPVLTSDKPDFRDPKVFWHAPSAGWVMIVAAGEQVEMYRSPDLKAWRFASAFGTGCAPGIVWECPYLFPLTGEDGNDVWILLSSFLSRDNFKGQFGPCSAVYFAGNFDGYAFAASEEHGEGKARPVSFGPDDYAPVTFANAPGGRQILLGWLNHWGYAGHFDTSPWTGQMTLPRELAGRNGALVQSLPPELEDARFWPRVEWRQAAENTDQADFDAPVWEIVVPTRQTSWRLEARQGEELIFSLDRDAARGVWAVERGRASLPPLPEDKPGRDAFFYRPPRGAPRPERNRRNARRGGCLLG